MRETLPTNVWDFTNHPEWQDVLDGNGAAASHERYAPERLVVVDAAKLSADALRLNELVIGRRDLDHSA